MIFQVDSRMFQARSGVFQGDLRMIWPIQGVSRRFTGVSRKLKIVFRPFRKHYIY